MKGSTGTNTGSIIKTRKPQRGNVLCKDCKHLRYSVSPLRGSVIKKHKIVSGTASNYICDVTGEPKSYTKRCYCKNYEKLK